jgi:hypothetical protein
MINSVEVLLNLHLASGPRFVSLCFAEQTLCPQDILFDDIANILTEQGYPVSDAFLLDPISKIWQTRKRGRGKEPAHNVSAGPAHVMAIAHKSQSYPAICLSLPITFVDFAYLTRRVGDRCHGAEGQAEEFWGKTSERLLR